MNSPVKIPRKLIEVALPLDDINIAAAREKSIRHGHPSTLHLWWARRPLAAARAVIFAQLVNDPSWKWEMEHPGEIPPSHLKASWAASRKRLFALISDLVKWDNTNDEALLQKAREEIDKSWRDVCDVNREHPSASSLFDPGTPPELHDPFAGGGAIPLEAQRLGIQTLASDLNPVAVTINKAMLDIPAKFAGLPPVHPDARSRRKLRSWTAAEGLAEDVKFYGAWVREEALRKIGHLYPNVRLTQEMVSGRDDLASYVGKELTPIAWLWARTVRSPDPAFSHVDVPLVSSFVLSSKKGKEAYVLPVVEGDQYRFAVVGGRPTQAAKNGTKSVGRGASFRCLVSGAVIGADYIRSEAKAGRMGSRLMAIVAEGRGSRVFLEPLQEAEHAANVEPPQWRPDIEFFQQALGFRVGNYGMTKWSDLFTARQLVALETFSSLVHDVREKARQDAESAGLLREGGGLADGGAGAEAYGDSIAVYLAFLVDQLANHCSSICGWNHSNAQMRSVFSRHAISMTWDFAEVNVFSSSSGSFQNLWERQVKSFGVLGRGVGGRSVQMNATSISCESPRVFSTDPPYYENIGYADLSDFFYVWLRRSLRGVFPSVFSSMVVPKAEELVATPHRHGGRGPAEGFFMSGMGQAMRRILECSHPAFPITIYYAFKQSEKVSGDDSYSTGWDTFLEAVIAAGLSVVGTWPMRTEKKGRVVGNDANALASSVVLVCRRRGDGAGSVSRRQFVRELNRVLPEALDEMTMGAGAEHSPVAPVDLSQAVIGPGMAVFSKYEQVLEADGTPMQVRVALQLINRFLAEDDFDADTQFCLRWFEQHGWNEGQYGEADVLARAKATSVGGVVDAGVLLSSGGKVRLLRWAAYPQDWDPGSDKRLPVWEALHQLIRSFKGGGEASAGAVLGRVKEKTEAIRQLGYRLYTLCERRGWAEDARAYNEIVTSWSAIEAIANALPAADQQLDLELGEEQ